MSPIYLDGKAAGLAGLDRMFNPHDPIVSGASFAEWNRGHADGKYELQNPKPRAVVRKFRPILWE
jgi:hypothetical protein